MPIARQDEIGGLIAGFRLNSMPVTLGGYLVVLGITYILGHGKSVMYENYDVGLRLDKPVGIWLLFFPAAWAVLLHAQQKQTQNSGLDPAAFDPMLGVHAVGYAMIGGLATAVGPLLGAAFDLGLLEATRLFEGWRMVLFGTLVALFLRWRPRGLLDEAESAA